MLTVRKAIFVVLVVSLVAGLSSVRSASAGVGPDGLSELTKEKGVFKTTLISPDAEFSSYSKLCPTRVLLQFQGPSERQEEASTGSIVRKKRRGAEIPEGEDLATFRQIITDAFLAELKSCEHVELVDERGPETLLVRATITDILTDIASTSRKSGKDTKPYSVQGAITFDLIDAETGAILARVGESRKSRKAGDSVAVPDAGPKWVNIWFWADQAAADLRLELERILDEERG